MSDLPDEVPPEPQKAGGTTPAAEEVAAAGSESTPEETTARAALSTGLAIVAILTGGQGSVVDSSWVTSVVFVTAVFFGPFTLAAALGARGLLRHRPWAPLLLVLAGIVVAATGLAIVSLAVSQATAAGASGPPSDVVDFLGMASTDGAWWVAAMAALHSLSGALEVAAGIMGRTVALSARSVGAGAS